MKSTSDMSSQPSNQPVEKSITSSQLSEHVIEPVERDIPTTMNVNVVIDSIPNNSGTKQIYLYST